MDLVKFLTWVLVHLVLSVACALAGAALLLREVASVIENLSWETKGSWR